MRLRGTAIAVAVVAGTWMFVTQHRLQTQQAQQTAALERLAKRQPRAVAIPVAQPRRVIVQRPSADLAVDIPPAAPSSDASTDSVASGSEASPATTARVSRATQAVDDLLASGYASRDTSRNIRHALLGLDRASHGLLAGRIVRAINDGSLELEHPEDAPL